MLLLLGARRQGGGVNMLTGSSQTETKKALRKRSGTPCRHPIGFEGRLPLRTRSATPAFPSNSMRRQAAALALPPRHGVAKLPPNAQLTMPDQLGGGARLRAPCRCHAFEPLRLQHALPLDLFPPVRRVRHDMRRAPAPSRAAGGFAGCSAACDTVSVGTSPRLAQINRRSRSKR
eukprot:scaffold10356_cov118-Isochrysis_galbana.AAC.6